MRLMYPQIARNSELKQASNLEILQKTKRLNMSANLNYNPLHITTCTINVGCSNF